MRAVTLSQSVPNSKQVTTRTYHFDKVGGCWACARRWDGPPPMQHRGRRWDQPACARCLRLPRLSPSHPCSAPLPSCPGPQVFAPDTTQERLYATAISGIVEEVLEGFNCTIFACAWLAPVPRWLAAGMAAGQGMEQSSRCS